MKGKKAVVLFLIIFHVFNILCYGQNNQSIVGNWQNISKTIISDYKIVGTSYLVFNNDMTFVYYIHSVIIGGEMDGLEGTEELIRGRYSLSGNRLTLYVNAPLSGQITDICSINITNNSLELTGFNNINNQFWFESVKWEKR